MNRQELNEIIKKSKLLDKFLEDNNAPQCIFCKDENGNYYFKKVETMKTAMQLMNDAIKLGILRHQHKLTGTEIIFIPELVKSELINAFGEYGRQCFNAARKESLSTCDGQYVPDFANYNEYLIMLHNKTLANGQ